MADDYEFGATYDDAAPTAAFDWDSFITGVMGSLSPTDQQVAASLGGNDIETYFGSSNGTNIGGVASGAAIDPKKDPSGIAKWWKELDAGDKKIGMSALAMLGGGLANIGKGKREDKALQIQQQNADANTAGVAERARQFNQQMANASSIGQTNFGTATQPMGMINAPVSLTRNRLKPTPGMPA